MFLVYILLLFFEQTAMNSFIWSVNEIHVSYGMYVSRLTYSALVYILQKVIRCITKIVQCELWLNAEILQKHGMLSLTIRCKQCLLFYSIQFILHIAVYAIFILSCSANDSNGIEIFSFPCYSHNLCAVLVFFSSQLYLLQTNNKLRLIAIFTAFR